MSSQNPDLITERDELRAALLAIKSVLKGDFGTIKWIADAPTLAAYGNAVELARKALALAPSTPNQKENPLS